MADGSTAGGARDEEDAESVRRAGVQFARLRLTAGNPYLAYGVMADLPEMEIPDAVYSWYHYNHDQNDPSYKAGGTYAAPSVMASAFRDGKGGYALFLANADRQPHAVLYRVPAIAGPFAGGRGPAPSRRVSRGGRTPDYGFRHASPSRGTGPFCGAGTLRAVHAGNQIKKEELFV